MPPNLDTDSRALQQRIKCNANSSEDFDSWALGNLALKGNLSVLELGCGTGKFIIPIGKRVPGGVVIGVDVSQESLYKIYHSIVPLNVQLMKADFDTLDLGEAKFDRILSAYSIYYSKDLPKLITKIYQMLKPGGIFFCCGPSSGNNAELKYLCNYSGNDLIEAIMEIELPALLYEAFHNLEVLHFGNVIRFESRKDILAYWASSNLYDKGQEAEFIRSIAGRNAFTNTKKIVGYRCIKNVG